MMQSPKQASPGQSKSATFLYTEKRRLIVVEMSTMAKTLLHSILTLALMASVVFACPPGRYRDRKDGLCHKCHPCLRTLVLVKNCTATSDTVCACDKETYLDFSKQSCFPCTRCPKDRYVIEDCRHDKDTVCSKCPKGSFFNVTSCIPCKHCSDVLKECKDSSDTVCALRPTKDGITPSCKQAFGASCTSINRTTGSTGKNVPIIVGVISSLLLIFVILLIIWLIKRKKSTKGKDFQKRISMMTEASNLTLDGSHSEYVKFPLPNKDSRSWVTSIDEVNGTSSRICGPEFPLKKITDLRYDVREKISILLLPSSSIHRGWKTLACKVGMDNALITFLASKKGDPVLAVLARMETAEGFKATVQFLYDTLKEMGRYDVMACLKDHLYEESQGQEVV